MTKLQTTQREPATDAFTCRRCGDAMPEVRDVCVACGDELDARDNDDRDNHCDRCGGANCAACVGDYRAVPW